MSRQDLIAAARAPIDAFGEKDWVAARKSMTPDCVFEELSTGRTFTGVDDVIESWKIWGEAFPDGHATVEESLIDGTTVVLRLTWHGTNTGALTLPSGNFAPTGKSVSFKSCQITSVENGRAATTRHYWDLNTMLSQLGIAAATPGAPLAG